MQIQIRRDVALAIGTAGGGWPPARASFDGLACWMILDLYLKPRDASGPEIRHLNATGSGFWDGSITW